MSEKTKKIFGIIKQIVRWIWRIILSLLFVLCIVFQAPLKVLVLFGIFLLACIVLPLRLRKWFWSAVGIVVLVLIVWVFLPEKDDDWKPFTFDRELAILEANRRIPDSENAAVIYNQLLADYNESDFKPDFIDCNDKTDSEYWRAKDYPQAVNWIKSHKETINKLMQVSKLERCRFAKNQDLLLLIDVERAGAFRKWTQLLSRASNNDIAEGRIKEGLKKNYCILQMGNHLSQQPTFIEEMSGMAVRAVAIAGFKNFIITKNPNKKQLDSIEKSIEKVHYDWESDLPAITDYEKLLCKNMICSMLYEVNSKGQIRLMRDCSKAIRNLIPSEFNEIRPLNYFQIKLAKAGTIIKWFFVPSDPQKLSNIINRNYQKYYEMADLNFDWSQKPETSEFSWRNFKLNYKSFIENLTLIIEPGYYSIHDLYLRCDSGKKGALLLIALRRYKDKNGFWPENLEEIKDFTNEENFIDSANGGEFVYKLQGNTFILYSKGENGMDDNGEKSSGCNPTTNIGKADDIYIWPLSKPKKSKNPNEIQQNKNTKS